MYLWEMPVRHMSILYSHLSITLGRSGLWFQVCLPVHRRIIRHLVVIGVGKKHMSLPVVGVETGSVGGVKPLVMSVVFVSVTHASEEAMS